MVRFLFKLLFKQIILAVHQNFHRLLVATKLVSFSLKTQHRWNNAFFQGTIRVA